MSMIPMYNTETFQDIFVSAEDFLEEYDECALPKNVKSENLNTLYYLLYAKYGNNPIANRDVNQFKYKLFSIIFQYGPTWEKELEIQEEVRKLDLEQLRVGTKVIHNHSYNPNTEPSTSALEEIPTINDQSAQNVKKSVADAYATLLSLLDDSITEKFIYRFHILFKQFVNNENPVLYYEEN